MFWYFLFTYDQQYENEHANFWVVNKMAAFNVVCLFLLQWDISENFSPFIKRIICP
jgi:hypothetical protein